jgi:hypothetical protein
MKFFGATVLLLIGLSLIVLNRSAKRQLVCENVDRAIRGRARDRATRAAEKQFDADAIDTLESEGGLVTIR